MVTERVVIDGVAVDPLTVEELHGRLDALIRADQRAVVLHVNVHGLNLATSLPWLRRFYSEAEIVFCDGAGVKLGARLLGYHIPERITYADWLWQLAEFAARRNYGLYLLGGEPDIAERAAARLRERVPGLRIVGTMHGYFDKRRESLENQQVIADIRAVRPNILLVCFGMPLQEQWLMENRHEIVANVSLTGGAALDYISGAVARAPRWLTDHGMEWLGRMLIEPRRLWKRYIVGNPAFLWRVLKQRVRGDGRAS